MVINSILEDSKGNIWLWTAHHGLLKYNGTDFLQFIFEEQCYSDDPRCLAELNGQIWIGTHCGLFSYDGRSFTRFLEKDGLTDIRINAITTNKNNQLWMATNNGFALYDGTSFTNFSQAESYIDDGVQRILEDKYGQVWLVTEHNGLIKYDGKYFTQYSLKEGLTSDEITGLLEDDHGQLWISTYGGGINLFNTTGSFEHLLSMQDLSDDVTNQLSEDKSGNLWITTENNGLLKYDGITFTQFSEKSGLFINEVSHSIKDQNGHVWIGSGDNSAVISKFDGQSFTHYDKNQGLLGSSIWSIMEDKQGFIWVLTGYGINKFDGQSFLQFPEDDKLLDTVIEHLEEDKEGNIWIATHAGLVKYDGAYFTHFTTKEGLIDNEIIDVKQDSRGYLWICTRNGLSVFDGAQFYNFTKEQGLKDENTWIAEEDHLGNMWIGTPHGVYLLEIPHKARTDLRQLEATRIQAFHQKDGLKGEDVRFAGICASSKRQLWISTEKGLTNLNLEQFYANRNQHIPTLQWNSLLLNEHHIDFTNGNPSDLEEKLGDITFEKNTPFNTYPQKLVVPYDVNHLTFDFIAFDWAAPHSIQYQYQLEGLENRWSKPTVSNKVDYRNIPPGHYSFKVKAVGQANIWSEPIAYSFTVLPPWWLTWWAYIIYALLILGLLYRIFSFFKNRLILENELQRKAEETQRLQDLDNFKNRLITNLTHEFRTPLTVILGMTEQIRSKPKSLQQGIKLIENNGKNLLKLVNQLLDLSKLEDKSFQLNWQQGNIVPYLSYLAESFQSYAENQEVSLRLSTAVEALNMDYDSEQIKQIMNNLLSNAIKFTPPHQQVLINLTTKNHQLLIEVKDEGIGIASEHLPHIFNRFYQIPTKDKFSSSGTGIGLAHTKELVELMGGKISVESQLQQGTTFKVYLPIHHRATIETATLKAPQVNRSLTKVSRAAIEQLNMAEHTDLPQLLIVEDNLDVMTYLKSCLEDLYQLQFAQNGKIGIEKALEHIPDLIISDVMMPEKNGYELCDVLKKEERTSHIPIILLTAKVDVSSKMEGLRKGADVYLPKPFDKEELLLRLEKMTQRQQKLKHYFSTHINTKPAAVAKILNSEEKEIIQIEHVFIEKVKGIIAEHYSDEQFALPDLCEKLHLSRSQLYRKMKALIDISPSQFIRTYRLQEGKKLLETTDLTVAEVAWQVGFKERSHFSKAFHKEFEYYPTKTNN